MKKVYILLIIIAIILLIGIGYLIGYKVTTDNYAKQESLDESTSSSRIVTQDSETFYATIEENNNGKFLVAGLDINDINFRGEFSFSVDDETELEWRYTFISVDDLKIGNTISITFTGGVEESYPAKLGNVIRIQLLEDQIGESSIVSKTNTISNVTLPNTNVVAVDNSISQNEVSEERNYLIDTNKVTIEIDKNTITPKSISIIITNNNENELSFGEEFKIQNKVNNEWKDLEYLPNVAWNAIALITKGNSQTTKRLDIEYYYGELEKGTYRVVKPIFNGNGGEVDIYSDEFEIK